jgi:hypothetical protein
MGARISSQFHLMSTIYGLVEYYRVHRTIIYQWLHMCII